jgi:hypothetical protein
MFTKPTFEENIYMKIFRWLYIGLTTNIVFWLANLPFLIVALFLAIAPQNAIWFAASLLFVGPGLISLFAVIDQIMRKKDCEPVKDFFLSLRHFSRRGFVYWGISWLGSLIAIADIIFLMNFSFAKWILPFFILLIAIFVSIALNACYFQIRNPEAKISQVLSVSCYFVFKKWYVSIINLVLFSGIFIILLLKPPFGLTVFPCLLLGLVYLNLKKFRI